MRVHPTLNAACIRGIGLLFLASLVLSSSVPSAHGQRRRVPPGGRIAVVADARLAALRTAPNLSSTLLRRLGRGTLVSIRGAQRTADGLLFFRVAINRRTSGWLQSEAVVATWHTGDDQRLLNLISGPDEFERVTRAKIFLDTFPHSPLRPAALLLYSRAAAEAAEQLTRSAQRQFSHNELPEKGAPLFSYFLNYNGLDRYNRQGIRFVFDESSRTFHFDGAALRELARRYPRSQEASDAREMLEKLDALKTKK